MLNYYCVVIKYKQQINNRVWIDSKNVTQTAYFVHNAKFFGSAHQKLLYFSREQNKRVMCKKVGIT